MELRDGSPAQVGLDPGPIRDAERFLDGCTRAGTGHPRFPGAVGLLAREGVIVAQYATGQALRYADARGTELPPDQQAPMRLDTVFDMASVTKLFTSIAVMQLVERAEVDLDAPVAGYLPGFGKPRVTVRHLLTHTSGLAPDPKPPLWQGYPDIPSRRAAVLASRPIAEPGTYLYSDINLMVLGFLAEQVTGMALDVVVREGITHPLSLSGTGFNPPSPDRVAATEYQTDPPRGLVHGQVHDENAWALGGVSGHAGLFSTARDLAVLAQAILDGGCHGDARILRPQTVREMLSNRDDHGLGFELNRESYMGALCSPVTAGHTGFTGTSLVLDPRSRSIAILLTNRVHPTRHWGPINVARETWATALARAMEPRPPRDAR